ncbi:IspD/TarI family cytidylyltransferase [Campylobacter aviculae]|uniref:2-C-methyl-D-erythritol 4-phosphate cytidylyltransferase n=1 Tax=Campylobacter aviculae TaxID=2510190 RepID=A0A4U7BTG9_9BACT|nr:IspD/TarI family cytidylyltransferase [Campylobacter aviculae]TKX32194.1 2-C-methyl-D-erythritol 4-phosphate cytidylyltransferase [Campylobacter aviculae]
MKKIYSIAIILAAGSGKRMGNVILPKQFLTLSTKPIILITLERIIKSKLFEKIVLVINSYWHEYVLQILNNYNVNMNDIELVFGGEERIDSIQNALSYLDQNYICENSSIVVFDAVRPFITSKLMFDALEYARKYGVAVAGIEAKDTIYGIKNNQVDYIPCRKLLVNGQAPDSCKFTILKKSINQLNKIEKEMVTGTAQICYLKGYNVYIFKGDERNIKITTKIDYMVAKIIEKEWQE